MDQEVQEEVIQPLRREHCPVPKFMHRSAPEKRSNRAMRKQGDKERNPKALRPGQKDHQPRDAEQGKMPPGLNPPFGVVPLR